MRNTRIPFLLTFLALTFLACESSQDCCANVSLGVSVRLKNSAGADILNPTTPDFIEEEDIEVFYKVGNKLETMASLNKDVRLDNPKGFVLAWDGAGYLLNVTTNPTVGSKVETIIRIENRSDIKLKTKVTGGNNRLVTKLWYDDQLVWSTEDQTYPEVTITLE